MTEIDAIESVTREQVESLRKPTGISPGVCWYCHSSEHVIKGILGWYCKACNTASITTQVDGGEGR